MTLPGVHGPYKGPNETSNLGQYPMLIPMWYTRISYTILGLEQATISGRNCMVHLVLVVSWLPTNDLCLFSMGGGARFRLRTSEHQREALRRSHTEEPRAKYSP